MANDLQQLALIEKTSHLNYLRDFRVEQCQLFLQHKCTQHRPFSCFYWHFQNQRRRRPIRRKDGTFSYDPDFYCNDYDEQSGVCPNGDDCFLLHRNANDTEKRYHLRYYKTGLCTHDCDAKGNCLKNGLHCSYAHGANDLRQPVLDSREIQNSDLALERLTRLCISLENERALNDDPKWSDSHYVLANYKTEPCKRPPRLCRQGYACPQYHNPRDRRRNPSIFKYKSTPCPHVKQSDEWIDPTVCESGDNCKYCHTRTEQQFHPEIYKSTKCNDVSVTGYCPRGPFCAFAHIEQELKSYRDFDVHYTSELPLSSFIPIPEDKEVDVADLLSSSRNIPKRSSQPSGFEAGSFPGAVVKTLEQHLPDRHSLVTHNSGSGSFTIRGMLPQLSQLPSPPQQQQQQLFRQYHQLPQASASTFLNDQFLLSAAELAASHSYPPPSSFLSTLAASNLLSSITAHMHSISPEQHLMPPTNINDTYNQQPLPNDVKNLIGSSLTAIGLDNVNEDEFDKAASNEQNNELLLIDNDIDSFERSTTPATNNTSPTHLTAKSSSSSSNQITRPVNIPHSFTHDHFSHSSSAKSPFDAPNQLFDGTLESPIDAPFPEPSTSSGGSQRPGELYKMAGFSQDLPTSSYQFQSTSPQLIFQRLSTTSNNSLSPSSSATEMDLMRNRVLQMQTLAMTEKESSEHWRREAEDNRRLAIQLEQEKNRIIQQRDDAFHQIEQMRQSLVQNMRILPNDHDLLQLPLDDVRTLQAQLQKELSKLSMIEQAKSNPVQQAASAIPGTSTMTEANERSYVGLNAIVQACSKVYPDQLNPTQATSLVKYWLGGSECLDYISIYHNQGNETSSAHWHYVTFGLSDLHGDGRVHKVPAKDDPNPLSGYGFELTFRLKKAPENNNSVQEIPMWPCKLLQHLAKYVFKTGTQFHAGHHIPFGQTIHNFYPSTHDTLIRSLLITTDRQLQSFRTNLGSVEFLQLVGCFENEMEAAQECNVAQVIDLFSGNRRTGGSLLVTDMSRRESIFDIQRNAKQMIQEKIEKEGSQLGRVLARCAWNVESVPLNDTHFRSVSSIDLTFDLDAAKIFVKILRTRLRRGKWFIFDSLNNQSICFISTAANNQGIMVDSIQQIMILGMREAQIMLLPDHIDLCIDLMSHILDLKDERTMPLKYEIPFHTNAKIIISIVSSDKFPSKHFEQSLTLLSTRSDEVELNSYCSNMFHKTPFPSLLSFLILMIGCVLFTISTIYTIHRVQHSERWACKRCLGLSRLTIGCGVAITIIFGLSSVLLASVLSGKTRKKYFWGYRKNLCARILNGFVLFITFLLTITWLGITCLTFIPLYGLFYVYFVVCSGRYATAGGSFVNILNEINQHVHGDNEKPTLFKLADVCLPSYREYFTLSIVTTASCLVILIGLIFLMIAQGANHAYVYNDRARYEVAQNGDQEIEETKM
ncbi:unnamed protein product [Adineta ricciae]|uniref:C3H1-type domain-containing protein n=1 Tax=Adineta ricciae TaxID=249248 RepID=A0A814C380_ADIRI|nr:unnamed protein product [Adineta ricciae]